MVYKHKNRWLLGTEKLGPETIEVKDPPKDIPVPKGAKHKPWIDLKHNECQWALNDFWSDPSNKMPCCGLEVKDKRKRFCEYHMKVAKE